ncbi:MAG: hypothetical protein U0441_11280 [Polyangiaceae bacterium]
MSAPIAVAPSLSHFFHDVVNDALRARHVEATPEASGYLVSLLCEYAHPTEEAHSTFSEPLTFLLRDALEAPGPERLRRLRALGDGVLYAIGFFGEHLTARGADRKYIEQVGATAYQHAAAIVRIKLSRHGEPPIFSELSTKFERFAAVLGDVAEDTLGAMVRDSQSLVKVYERWIRTGSTRLADELGMHGIVLARGGTG